MTYITIEFASFGKDEVTSVDFRVDYDRLMANGHLTDQSIAEDYFKESNANDGFIHQLIQIKHLSEYGTPGRAISVGDRIIINGRVYKYAPNELQFEGVRQVG